MARRAQIIDPERAYRLRERTIVRFDRKIFLHALEIRSLSQNGYCVIDLQD